jgi:hypothetical protein
MLIKMDRTNAERQRRYIARLKAAASSVSNGAELEGDPLHNGAGLESEAQEPRGFTSGEQDQILSVVIELLKTVDHRHQKKFHKFYIGNTHQGVLIPTCSHVGWKSWGFGLDKRLLARLWAALAQRSA